MSEELLALVVDAATGETIERPLTEEEIVQREQSEARALAEKTEAEAKVASRQSALAKLAALGLTEEEIAAL
jgi:DNA-binding NarL/FixJ family response regulator